jgi:hypothetical protein
MGTLLNPNNAPLDPLGQAKPGQAKPGSNGINYHNGPVMTQPIKVYFIWYGDWNGNTATSILPDMVKGVTNSPYWKINTTYYQAGNIAVTDTVNWGGEYFTPAYLTNSLSDANIQRVVFDAISQGKLPKESDAVYFVLTSAEVTASSGFCTQYCGWHTHGTLSGTDIKYSFVGNPDRCPSACAAQTVGPNGNSGADGMASIIMHELEEAATDPDLNAWYDTRGYENADKCAWTFGTVYTTANGAKANMKLGARDFLIQRNWVNASGGYCALSY